MPCHNTTDEYRICFSSPLAVARLRCRFAYAWFLRCLLIFAADYFHYREHGILLFTPFALRERCHDDADADDAATPFYALMMLMRCYALPPRYAYWCHACHYAAMPFSFAGAISFRWLFRDISSRYWCRHDILFSPYFTPPMRRHALSMPAPLDCRAAAMRFFFFHAFAACHDAAPRWRFISPRFFMAWCCHAAADYAISLSDILLIYFSLILRWFRHALMPFSPFAAFRLFRYWYMLIFFHDWCWWWWYSIIADGWYFMMPLCFRHYAVLLLSFILRFSSFWLFSSLFFLRFRQQYADAYIHYAAAMLLSLLYYFDISLLYHYFDFIATLLWFLLMLPRYNGDMACSPYVWWTYRLLPLDAIASAIFIIVFTRYAISLRCWWAML